MLWSEDSAHGFQEGRVSLPNFADWKAAAGPLRTDRLHRTDFPPRNKDGPPERLRSARVPVNFFPLLGVQPLLGVCFPWTRRSARVCFDSQLRALAAPVRWIARTYRHRTLIMDGRKSRMIGVMPASFQYPFPDTQVWEPITAHPYWMAAIEPASVRIDWYVLGRSGRRAWQSAQSEMNGIGCQLRRNTRKIGIGRRSVSSRFPLSPLDGCNYR